LDAPKGSSPLFAVQDVVKELVKACDDEARIRIKNSKLKEIFRPEKNPLPAAYQWLLEQSENGDSLAQQCLREVHDKVMPDMEIDAGSMLTSLESYKEAKKQRDRNCHPCM